jgi:hypothetical protein
MQREIKTRTCTKAAASFTGDSGEAAFLVQSRLALARQFPGFGTHTLSFNSGCVRDRHRIQHTAFVKQQQL